MVLKCEMCGAAGEKLGPCLQPDCKKAKMKIVRFCAKSGIIPHTSDPDDKKK